MKKIILILLAGALLLGIWKSYAADETLRKDLKPVVVVSFAGIEALKKDVAFAGNLAVNADENARLAWWLNFVKQNLSIVGFDEVRPWGAVAQTDGKEISGFVFLPVKGLSTLVKVMEPIIGKTEDAGKGVYKIMVDEKPMFVTEKNGWTFFSAKQEALVQIPADPTVLLDGLNKQYDIAIRLHAANVPEKQYEKILQEFKNEIAKESKKRSGESDHEFALRTKAADYALQYITALTKEINTVTLGWKLDTEDPKSYLDFSITAVEGTQTAQLLAALKETKSDFAGFRLPDAAIVGNLTGKLPQQKIEILEMALNVARENAIRDIEKEKDEEKAKAAKQLVGKLIDMLQETVKNGRIDSAWAVVLKPQAVTFLTGAYVANNGTLEEVAQVIADEVKKKQPAISEGIKLNVGEHRGVKLHTVTIPIPTEAKDREKLISLIGDNLEIVFGTSPKSAYLAVGREPLKVLKEAIDQSVSKASQSVAPVDFSVSMEAIARFIAAYGEEESIRQKAATIAEELRKLAPRDHLTFKVSPTAQGVTYRLEIEEGVLKSISKLFEMEKQKVRVRHITDSSPLPWKEGQGKRTTDGERLVIMR